MKRTAVLMFGAVLAATMLATAQAGHKPPHSKTTICHRTSSAKHPYVQLRVSAAGLAGHRHHPGDIIPAPANGCPTTAIKPHHRGHLVTASLRGHDEVPGPGDPDGAGTARIRLTPSEGKLCFDLVVRNIILPATGAHVHQGPAGVAGPIVVPLTPPDATGTSTGCVAVDPALATAILADPSAFYANVHTTDYPAGAIRGQLETR